MHSWGSETGAWKSCTDETSFSIDILKATALDPNVCKVKIVPIEEGGSDGIDQGGCHSIAKRRLIGSIAQGAMPGGVRTPF